MNQGVIFVHFQKSGLCCYLSELNTILVRACSHYAKFCLNCEKICQHKAISSANDFLHPPKFLQAQRNFKDSVDCLEANKILSGKKILFSLTSICHWVLKFCNVWIEANVTVKQEQVLHEK